MIRVLVVDDEKIVRKGIIALMSWEKFGMRIIGEAENYVRAMAFLKENRTDLMFVDVTMPGKSGLEMIGEVRELYPATAVVMLTCHQDFHYIQTALRLGAIDYIVKTQLELDNMEETLARIARRVRERTPQGASCGAVEYVLAPNRYSEEINKGIQRALHYIEKNLTEHINQEEAARLAGMSKGYFSRCFKEIVGKLFVDYVNERKINKAKALLLEGNQLVYVIAARLGYTDEKYFSKLFKEHEGLLPSEYRRQERISE